MNNKKNGTVCFSGNKKYPYQFKNGAISIFLGNECHVLEEGCQSLLAREYNVLIGGYTLYHLSSPIINGGTMITKDENGKETKKPITFGNIIFDVDYYIDDYYDHQGYDQMRFQFKELDYFISSAHQYITTTENSKLIFSRQPHEILKFNFICNQKEVTLTLRTYVVYKAGVKSIAETISEVLLEFEKTHDFELLLSLYRAVHNTFSFICNRQNISLDKATLVGEKVIKTSKVIDGKTVFSEKPSKTYQTLNIMDKYGDDMEPDKVIAKTIKYAFVGTHFEQLFKIILLDKVSISSIHSSTKAKNLLDLKQCLHITAAFEYYHRTFLPEMSSQTTIEVYEDIKEILLQYTENQTGEKKKKAKSVLKSLAPTISLKDKIIKTYTGYSNWDGLKNVLDEWFGEQLNDLAKISNEWRNELAHEKREYEPDERIITAIRLVEHLNYCIVLRHAGLRCNEIKGFVEQVLKR